MTSDAKTVDAYLKELPKDRSQALNAVRAVVLAHLPQGYKEVMAYGMIGYVVPLKRYPNTYNKQPLTLAALASQKNYMVIYLMNVYGDPETEQWFRDEYKARGKKLDMGKSCVRFKKLEDLPLDLIGEAIAHTPLDEFIRLYQQSRKS